MAVTTSEQQAVPVAQEDRDLFALICPDMASLIYGGDLDKFPQMQGIATAIRAALTPDPPAGKPIDATQTREAELVAVLELAQPIVEADHDAAKESGDSDWEGMAYTALEAVNAALNGRAEA